MPRGRLELAHHHPGRLRVRSDEFCSADRDPKAHGRFERVRTALGAIEGVRSIHFNVLSGSVLVDYEPGAVDPNVLIDLAARAANLDPPASDEELRAAGPTAGWVAASTARELNAFTRDLTGGRADLRSLVPLTMTAVAAVSFVMKKDRLPRWDNLTYWAFAIFLSFHANEIAGEEGRRP